MGPFLPARAPSLPGETARLGDPLDNANWALAYAPDGLVDLRGALKAHDGEWIAYASAIVHVEHPGHQVFLFGADDGIEVSIDGVTVLSRDESRPQREDDDMVGIDLLAGDHPLTLRLHQHGGPWTLGMRWLDAELQPPRDGWWRLPGAGPSDVRALAAGLAHISLDRGMRDEDYVPRLDVSYIAGAPLDVPLGVRATLFSKRDSPSLFDVAVGDAPVSDRYAAQLTATLPAISAASIEDSDSILRVEVAGRISEFPVAARKSLREAVSHASSALSRVGTAVIAPGSIESVEHLRDRLAEFAARGDSDADANARDSRELEAQAVALQDELDPYDGKDGPMRRAYRSPADGHLSEFALYVPKGFDRAKRYPLIVALHGLNGRPMQMLSWLFGHDDGRDSAWQDRHPFVPLERLDAFVVVPDGHGNAGYRELGEDDVFRVIDWAQRVYPIDSARITITGPSMGGIGSAGCALRHPSRFAAAAPLCGYHNFFLRGDMAGRPLQPWERFLAEERSNVSWAENGSALPLFIVHGTRDLPLENSSVLVDRYDELHFDEVHDYPDLGHNVWQSTYEELKGAKWLLEHRRPLHPRSIHFKTSNPRWSDSGWVHVTALARSDTWGEVYARIDRANAITISTRRVRAITLDRDTRLIDDSMPNHVTIDKTTLTFQSGEPLSMHREDDGWHVGDLGSGISKRASVNGPIRDVFHEPLLFVWGDDDPSQARANEEVARAWSRVRPGVRVSYPVISDREFLDHGEAVQGDRSLFLVGNARSNRVVRGIESMLPIRIDGDDVVLVHPSSATGSPEYEHISSTSDAPWTSELGTMFIVANPLCPTRYVVVVEGIGAFGTWRSLSLPDMLPDYVVFDHAITPSRGGSVLGVGKLRRGGYFDNDWLLPRGPER